MMEFNRLLEIAAERAMCNLCVDCGDDACIACHKVKGVTATELREYHAAVGAALRRTAEHDKAMEEGRLVELPCKAGDTVYIADRWGKKVDEFQVNWFTFDGEKIMCWEHRSLQPITPDIWGKTVFLTRQEAETALGGGGDG